MKWLWFSVDTTSGLDLKKGEWVCLRFLKGA